MREQTRAEQQAFAHHIEHSDGWEYKHTSAFQDEHPKGWDYKATQPVKHGGRHPWHLNTDKQVSYDGERNGHELIAPGVIRIPHTASDRPLLVAYWRRKK